MAGASYRNVQAIIGVADTNVSGPIVSALFPRGLHDVVVCRDGDALIKAVNSRLVDILLLDFELPNTDYSEIIYNIRQNQIGQNPFMHIVAMVPADAKKKVKRAIAAGVDDVLIKPVRAIQVIERFEHLLRQPRSFIVAEAYIGPERRKRPREGEAELPLPVPHTLRSKVAEKTHPTEVSGQVSKAWLQVAVTMASRPPRAIKLLTNRVLEFFEGGGVEAELRRDLLHLAEKAEELVKRHKSTETSHIAEVASGMAGVVRRIAETPFPPKRLDMRVFPEVSDATRLSVSAPKKSADTVREIADLVHESLKLPRLTEPASNDSATVTPIARQPAAEAESRA